MIIKIEITTETMQVEADIPKDQISDGQVWTMVLGTIAIVLFACLHLSLHYFAGPWVESHFIGSMALCGGIADVAVVAWYFIALRQAWI